jgi:hypothetical protein
MRRVRCPFDHHGHGGGMIGPIVLINCERSSARREAGDAINREVRQSGKD